MILSQILLLFHEDELAELRQMGTEQLYNVLRSVMARALQYQKDELVPHVLRQGLVDSKLSIA